MCGLKKVCRRGRCNEMMAFWLVGTMPEMLYHLSVGYPASNVEPIKGCSVLLKGILFKYVLGYAMMYELIIMKKIPASKNKYFS